IKAMAWLSWLKPCARCCRERCPLVWNATPAISTSLQHTISLHLRRLTRLKKIWTRCSNGYERPSQPPARSVCCIQGSWNTRKNASGGSTESHSTRRSSSGLRRSLANWVSHHCKRSSTVPNDLFCPLSLGERVRVRGFFHAPHGPSHAK